MSPVSNSLTPTGLQVLPFLPRRGGGNQPRASSLGERRPGIGEPTNGCALKGHGRSRRSIALSGQTSFVWLLPQGGTRRRACPGLISVGPVGAKNMTPAIR